MNFYSANGNLIKKFIIENLIVNDTNVSNATNVNAVSSEASNPNAVQKSNSENDFKQDEGYNFQRDLFKCNVDMEAIIEAENLSTLSAQDGDFRDYDFCYDNMPNDKNCIKERDNRRKYNYTTHYQYNQCALDIIEKKFQRALCIHRGGFSSCENIEKVCKSEGYSSCSDRREKKCKEEGYTSCANKEEEAKKKAEEEKKIKEEEAKKKAEEEKKIKEEEAKKKAKEEKKIKEEEEKEKADEEKITKEEKEPELMDKIKASGISNNLIIIIGLLVLLYFFNKNK